MHKPPPPAPFDAPPPPPVFDAPPPAPFAAPPPAGAPPYGVPPAQQPPSPPPGPALSSAPPPAADLGGGPTDPEHVAPNAPRALAGFLVSFDGHDLGISWPIHQGINLVGRKDAADGLQLEIDHPTTSSRHAKILASARPGRLKIEDLNSTNGTFVRDQKLAPGTRLELRDGDPIRFGGFSAIVKII